MRFNGLFKALLLWLVIASFFSIANNSFGTSDIFVQALNAALFTTGYYVSYHLLTRKFLYRKQAVKFMLGYLLLISVLSAVSLVSVYQVYVFQQKKFYVDHYWSGPVFIASNFILMLLVTSTLLGFRVIRDKMDTQKKLEQLQREKISTELAFLKAQINPHFLFNSLNNILFQIDKTNQAARETLLRFSDILRYQLYECSGELVAIEDEVLYLKNYRDIQMLRRAGNYDCRFTVSDRVGNFSIAPLLLIPFVENAFKHVSHHAGRTNMIDVALDYRDGMFLFSISNDRNRLRPAGVQEQGGIGLANVRRRLDLLYGQNYMLAIDEGEDVFSVSLRIAVAKSPIHEQAEMYRN